MLPELREHQVTRKLRNVRAVSNRMKQQHISEITLPLEPMKETDNCQFAYLHQFFLMYDDVVVVL